MQRYRPFLLALLTVFVVGCGGGSSSGSSDTTSASGDDVEGLSTPSRVSIVDAES